MAYTYKTANGELTTTRRLAYMPNAQAGIDIYSNGEKVLISYHTEVLSLTPDNYLTCYGLFSMTTRRHISAFLKEFCPQITFQTVKYCYDNNYSINIKTGELK